MKSPKKIVVPFVKREKTLSPRTDNTSTALSARYDGWGGLYDNHGQHTMILEIYEKTDDARGQGRPLLVQVQADGD